MNEIEITEAQTSDLPAICNLQKANIDTGNKLLADQGFVTGEHSLNLLIRINNLLPIKIAKEGERLVGYCIAIEAKFLTELPELIPHFNLVNSIMYNGNTLEQLTYLMGEQVCVDQAFRRRGIAQRLYKEHKLKHKHAYPLMVAGIRSSNTASLEAHKKVNFIEHEKITDPATGHSWTIVVWNWKIDEI